MMRWSLHIIFLFWISFSFGQKLNLNLDKEEVLIGEPFTLTYSVISEVELDSIVYFDYNDFFPGKNSQNSQTDEVNSSYEIEISAPFEDTVYQEGDEFIWKGKYKLVAWDSAYVIIPPEVISIKDSMHVFPAGLIHVLSPAIDGTKPIYDINEVFTSLPEKNPIYLFLEKHWWWLAIASVVLIAIGLLLLRNARKEPTPLSLRERTLAKIDDLEKAKGYESDLKEYYYNLSVILRRFFASHYQIQIMDKTTSEIEIVLARNGLDKEKILLTRQLLMQSDMVKFAKSTPELNEIMSVTNDARKVVNEIVDLDEVNEK
ncbi:protein BatD [Brumimicrobium oceani]|uniref:Protein BatD n=1 Tax=Brumimicrobium oceani TaxID=2100725 RepID=A0A2U2XCL1_9FLAO|nr:protein BatD [Brumimicrobium oceani]PWH85518.1 hypothetical protein DIT68_09710 [Brumimicrobium oceani]